MVIKNLTPHAVVFVDSEENPILTVEPSGQVARVSAHIVSVDEKLVKSGESLEKIPVTTTVFGSVEGLPEPEKGVIYLVSSMVAQRVPERTDVFIPNDSVRDERGSIIGCRSLGRI